VFLELAVDNVSYVDEFGARSILRCATDHINTPLMVQYSPSDTNSHNYKIKSWLVIGTATLKYGSGDYKHTHHVKVTEIQN
jgi:hypothetical protein